MSAKTADIKKVITFEEKSPEEQAEEIADKGLVFKADGQDNNAGLDIEDCVEPMSSVVKSKGNSGRPDNGTTSQALNESGKDKDLFGGFLKYRASGRIATRSYTDQVAEGNTYAWQSGYKPKDAGQIAYKFPSFEQSSVLKVKKDKTKMTKIPTEKINIEKNRHSAGWKYVENNPDELTGLEQLTLQGKREPQLVGYNQSDHLGNVVFQDANNYSGEVSFFNDGQPDSVAPSLDNLSAIKYSF